MTRNGITSDPVAVVDGWVYCHACGAVHQDEPDPYQTGEDCSEQHIPLFARYADYHGPGVAPSATVSSDE